MSEIKKRFYCGYYDIWQSEECEQLPCQEKELKKLNMKEKEHIKIKNEEKVECSVCGNLLDSERRTKVCIECGRIIKK